jgi:hypothetical protein
MRKNILAGLLMLIIAGCGETIYSGRITDKQFIPAHWAKESHYVYNFIKEEYEWEDEDVYYEDKYLIEICNYTESKNFLCKTLEVSPAQFSELEMGEWYIPVVESQ